MINIFDPVMHHFPLKAHLEFNMYMFNQPIFALFVCSVEIVQ